MIVAEKMAKEEQSDDYTAISKFTNKVERQIAKQLLRQYLHDYVIETIADKNTLKDLIYLETVQRRLQDKVNEYHDKDTQAIPLQLVEAIHKNTDAIQKLKVSLRENKPDLADDYGAFKHLLKRAQKWREENQLSREFRCPHCQQMTLLKLRTECYETQKHPFFADKRLYNKHLFDNLNKEVLIDREFIAKVLETSPDYIDWMLEKIREKNPSDIANQQNELLNDIEKGESSGEKQEQTEERKEESTETSVDINIKSDT
jgi:DNA-directed RNA polymerase subunit RPC12/RpoP